MHPPLWLYVHRAAGPSTPRNEPEVTLRNCGIATCLNRAIDMAELSSAGLWPCRPLHGQSDFPSPVGSSSFPQRIFPRILRLKRSPAYTPWMKGYTSSSTALELHTAIWLYVQTAFPNAARHLPRAPLPESGVTSLGEMSRISSAGITQPSSLIRTHAPHPIPPPGSARCSSGGSLQVAASPCWKMVVPDVISILLV